MEFLAIFFIVTLEKEMYHSMMAASAQDGDLICLNKSSFVFQNDHLAEKGNQKHNS